MYRLLATITLCFLLSGCAAPPTQVPAWLVLLTPNWPMVEGMCTGFVVGPRQIMTAAHCTETVRRVVTTTGQEALVESARVSLDHDVALLTTDRVLWVNEFAEFANPALHTQATVMGFCPFQVSFVPRVAFYNGLVEESIEGAPIQTYGEWIMPRLPGAFNMICGGDSGSAVTQDGKVVGVLSAAQSEYYFIALGSIAFTVPPQEAIDLLNSP